EQRTTTESRTAHDLSLFSVPKSGAGRSGREPLVLGGFARQMASSSTGAGAGAPARLAPVSKNFGVDASPGGCPTPDRGRRAAHALRTKAGDRPGPPRDRTAPPADRSAMRKRSQVGVTGQRSPFLPPACRFEP